MLNLHPVSGPRNCSEETNLGAASLYYEGELRVTLTVVSRRKEGDLQEPSNFSCAGLVAEPGRTPATIRQATNRV